MIFEFAMRGRLDARCFALSPRTCQWHYESIRKERTLSCPWASAFGEGAYVNGPVLSGLACDNTLLVRIS